MGEYRGYAIMERDDIRALTLKRSFTIIRCPGRFVRIAELERRTQTRTVNTAVAPIPPMAPNDPRKKRKKKTWRRHRGQKRQVHGTAPTVIGYEGSFPEEGPGLTIFTHVKRSAEKFATARRVLDGETLIQGVNLTGIPDLLPEIF